MTAQRLDPLLRQHVEEAERVGPAGEQVQPGVRGHRDDPPGPGQAGEQRLRRVGANAGAAQRAQHLGVTGKQLHPGRVRALREGFRDRHPGTGNAAQPQEPAAVAGSLGVLDADDAQRARRPQPPVAAGDGLVGHAEDLRDRAERGAPVHSEALRQLPVEIVDRDAFHQNNASSMSRTGASAASWIALPAGYPRSYVGRAAHRGQRGTAAALSRRLTAVRQSGREEKLRRGGTPDAQVVAAGRDLRWHVHVARRRHDRERRTARHGAPAAHHLQ